MSRFLLMLVSLALFRATAGEPRIDKVLPHLLDSRGRVALSPSLFERDAYQAHLRQHPTNIAGLRFDLNWKAPRQGTNAVTVRMELRTANRTGKPPLVLETTAVPSRWGRNWTPLTLDGDAFRREGDVVAWRAVLLQGDRELASIRSFLW